MSVCADQKLSPSVHARRRATTYCPRTRCDPTRCPCLPRAALLSATPVFDYSISGFLQVVRGFAIMVLFELNLQPHSSMMWARRCCAVAARQRCRRERLATQLPNSAHQSTDASRFCICYSNGSKCTRNAYGRAPSQEALAKGYWENCAVVVRVWRTWRIGVGVIQMYYVSIPSKLARTPFIDVANVPILYYLRSISPRACKLESMASKLARPLLLSTCRAGQIERTVFTCNGATKSPHTH
jgi:hypothetical protein